MMKTLLHPLAALLISGVFVVACSRSASTSGASTKPFPLKTCLVSGKNVESMGRTVSRVYDGQEIKFCCPPCIEKFEARPAEYLARLK